MFVIKSPLKKSAKALIGAGLRGGVMRRLSIYSYKSGLPGAEAVLILPQASPLP